MRYVRKIKSPNIEKVRILPHAAGITLSGIRELPARWKTDRPRAEIGRKYLFPILNSGIP